MAPLSSSGLNANVKSRLNVINVDNGPANMKPISFVDQKMVEAFGAPLLNSDGRWMNDMWENIWKRTVKLRGKLYTLPGGSVGRLFVSTLAAEVLELGKGKQKSEVPIHCRTKKS